MHCVRWKTALVLLGLFLQAPASAEDGRDARGRLQRLAVRDAVALSAAARDDRALAKQLGLDADLLEDEGGEVDFAKPEGDGWRAAAARDHVIDLRQDQKLDGLHVVYAFATLREEATSAGALTVGCEEAVKIWLNGELVHESSQRSTLDPSGQIVPIELRAGDNRLLIKAFADGQRGRVALRVLSPAALIDELVRAVVQGNAERMKDLLALGVDVNGRGRRGLTAYQAARIEGRDRLAKQLLVLGAEKDVELDAATIVDGVLEDASSQEQPGAAVLLARGDEVLYAKGFGMANLAHAAAVTPTTKFRIGSVTKQFAAAAILKLEEEGKLSVSDPLEKFFSGFPKGDVVTLHHLLTHTSGLKNYTSKAGFFDDVVTSPDVDEMLKSFREDGYDFEPGEKFAYCNTGYFLLGQIVEQVSGQSLADYWKTTFFEPLGMRDTGVHETDGVYLHEATGYSLAGETVKKALDWDMSWAGAAGNLYSTVHDLHRWNQGVFGGRVLKAKTLERAHQVQVGEAGADISMPYGYGWMVDEFRGQRRISHSGGLQGFVSQLSYYPDLQVSVVALHNAFPGVQGLNPQAAAQLMVKAFLWKELGGVATPAEAKIDPDILADYVGRYDYRSAVMTVTQEDDRLYAQLTGQPRYQIFPAGPDKFFWKVVEAQVDFVRDEAGNVESARHSQGIVKFTAARIAEWEEVAVAEEVLDRYAGAYDYGFGGKLTIRRDGQHLKAQMTGQPEFTLYAKSETEFFWRAVHARIVFQLTDSGEVNGATHYQAGQEIKVTRLP